MVQEYADGVWLVALEALRRAIWWLHQIATVLEIARRPGGSLVQKLTDHLRQ